MKWSMVELHRIAPAKASDVAFPQESLVWHLTLDQIESHTGRIVNKRMAPASTAGNSTYTFDSGNVLYSKLRPYLNKVVRPAEAGIATTELVPLRPLPGVLDGDYLAHYLRSADFLTFAQSCVAGAKMPRVIMARLWNHLIPLPPLSEQRRIAEILNRGEALRQKRVDADYETSRLVPSTFVDLFGDPVSNSKRWPIRSMSDFFTDPRHGPKCGPFGSALKKQEYIDAGIPVWGIDNVAANRFLEANSLFISESKFSELTAYSVEGGDILISRAGTVGRMCVARPTVTRSIIGTNLIRLSFDVRALEPEYFSTLFTYFPQIAHQLRAASDEGAYSFMNTSILRSLQIPVPPVLLQRRFAELVRAARTLDDRQADSRNKVQKLFESLLSHSFNGTLTAKWRGAHSTDLLAEITYQLNVLGLPMEQTQPTQ